MRRLLLIVLVLLWGTPALAQLTTTVSGTITDSSAQAWANGSIQFVFRPSDSNPTGQYFQNGVPFDKSTTVPTNPLALDNSGSFAGLVVPNNATISPSGSTFSVKVCPAATTPCFIKSLTITGATQNISGSIIPPPVHLDLSVPLAGARAYTDSEVFGAVPGTLYFNVTDNLFHACIQTGFPPCTWTVVGAGTITGSGASGQVAVFSGPSSIAGDPNFTWNTAAGNLNVFGGTGSGNLVLTTGATGGMSLNLVPGANEVILTSNETGGLLALEAEGNIQIGVGGSTTPISANGPFTFNGATSGSAPIGAAAIAGTPNRINLPTTTGTNGQVLTTNGGNPQQTSWTTPTAGVTSVTGTANQITSSGGTTPVLSIPATFIAPGSVRATTALRGATVTDDALTSGNCVQAGAAGLLTTIALPCNSGFTQVQAVTFCAAGCTVTATPCTTGSSSFDFCQNTLTWPVAWADTNYAVACSGVNPVDPGNAPNNGRAYGQIQTKTTTTIVFNTVTNGASAVHWTEIDCTASHN